ncbi:MAG: SDR family NAD(P)-dependent oxidoreductase [Alphaproteobacteria bacterium]
MTQTVLITGGSRGIGYATAELFAQRGWNVALCSRNEQQAKAAAEKIYNNVILTPGLPRGKDLQKTADSSATPQNDNPKIFGLKADVGNPHDVDDLFASVKKHFGALDALVNNAGILHTGNVFSLTDEQFDDMVRINLTGLARCCRRAFEMMKISGGSIVNISSIAGIQSAEKFSGLWAYTATKSAVVGLSEALALEGKPYGIRVNCLAPGATETEMLHKAAPGLKADAQPEDIAKIAYYLCDKEQSGILSGSVIPVFSNG